MAKKLISGYNNMSPKLVAMHEMLNGVLILNLLIEGAKWGK